MHGLWKDAPELTPGGGIFESGTELAGYRIRSLLGKGGMGVVYLATHTRLDREVALKVIAPECKSEPEFEERFLRESQLAASLDHPNVLPIYDAGEADGEIYLAMRYVDGGDLRTMLKDQSRLPAALAVEIARQIALALDAAHQAGLVHRDVKPANILLGGNKHAYLSDFGLARRESSSGLTRTGIFMGTPDYSSPEQLEGVKAIDGRADVYSLGCVLYHCLVGQPPFVRESEVGVITAHLHDPPPQLSQLRPDLPPALSQILSEAMAKERTDRFRTAAEFARALSAVLAELSGEGESRTTPRRERESTVVDRVAAPAKREAPRPESPAHVGETVLDPVAGQIPLKPQAAVPRKRGAFRRAGGDSEAPIEPPPALELPEAGRPWRSGGRKRVVAGVLGFLVAVVVAVVAVASATGHKRAPGGAGASSAASGVPARPERIVLVRASDNSYGVGDNGAAKLSFTVPASRRRSVTRVEWQTVRGQRGLVQSGSITPPNRRLVKPLATSASASGLSNGVTYSFTVRPCNAAGCAAWSRPSNTVTPFGRPLPPTAGARSSGTTIVFRWSGGGKRGRPVGRYQISIDGGGWQNAGRRPGQVTRRYGYAQTHSVRVRVVDSTGQTSAASRLASARTPAAPQSKPAPAPPAPSQTVIAVNQ